MSNYATKKYKEPIDIKDQVKIKLIKSIIPDDVTSILDVGCGNGIITNELAERYEILGVDINPDKLQYVKTEKLLSPADKIPKPDKTFDMVFSSEMLEHLTDDLLSRTVKEFDRLAKNYILLTVPYNEDLEKLLVKCEYCKSIFHKNGHLHSFTEEKLKNYFPKFNIKLSRKIGQRVRGYNHLLATIKHRFTPSHSWIPGHWMKSQGVPYTYCTNCGKKNEIYFKFNIISFFLDCLNIFLSSKKKSQLVLLLERNK